MTDGRRRLGAHGEDLAAAWYEAHGYEVLVRNWRCRHGEIDLVCADSETIVICEVKTRTTLAYGHPAEAVTLTKQRRLRQLTAWLLQSGDLGVHRSDLRFDVAAVVGTEVEVIQSAF